MKKDITAIPSNEDEVRLLDGEIYEFYTQYKLLESPYTSSGNYNITKGDNYAPCEVVISWEYEGNPLYYTVKIATRADLSDAISIKTSENSVKIGNLYAGQNYYYQITASLDTGTAVSEIFNFRTAELPRTVWIEGVSNTRDIGGYYTGDGKYRIKQGMVYRGAMLHNITEDGKDYILNTLGVKTDLDLRGEGHTESPLGEAVNYYNYACPSYIWSDENKDKALANAVKILADRSNYPVYLHCSLGRDRTSTLVFLIEAMLGIGQLDLYMDYELSFFSVMGHYDGLPVSHYVDRNFTVLYDYIKDFSNGTLAENAEKYLISLGVTKDEINRIKDILLEEVGKEAVRVNNITVK